VTRENVWLLRAAVEERVGEGEASGGVKTLEGFGYAQSGHGETWEVSFVPSFTGGKL
jgi:hypothetical protein